MSLGALSREAHETLAVALNRIGGKSNSGEVRAGVRQWVRGPGRSETRRGGWEQKRRRERCNHVQLKRGPRWRAGGWGVEDERGANTCIKALDSALIFICFYFYNLWVVISIIMLDTRTPIRVVKA